MGVGVDCAVLGVEAASSAAEVLQLLLDDGTFFSGLCVD